MPQITITYPPDYDGVLDISVHEEDYAFAYSFRHAKAGDAFETLAKAAEGIVAQAMRRKSDAIPSASPSATIHKTVRQIIDETRRVPSELHPLFETLINHFGTYNVLMSLLDLISEKKWTLERFSSHP